MNAFFELPTLLVELLVCHPPACCGKCGGICHNACSCCNFFSLVRTDAYSYMNLTGIPFCNSARQCETICDNSHQFIGNHSAMKHYNFAAHVFCIALAFLVSYFVLKYRTENYGFWQIAIFVTMLLLCITYFIKIHSDAAEGLQTAILAGHEANQVYDYVPDVFFCLFRIFTLNLNGFNEEKQWTETVEREIKNHPKNDHQYSFITVNFEF